MAAADDMITHEGQEPTLVGLAGLVVSGTYRITRVIGAGGMGEVYEAEHLRLGRRVAVKVLRSRSDERALNRFRRETRVIASLESDHVVDVYDCGELKDGTPYLVMELLRGEDLRGLLRTTPRLPVARAVNIVRQAARGVAAAHRAGVVHRDLKPENLFLARREGEDERVKVLDFGVAKTETSELTQTGTVIGTIKYMAPEQLEDSASVGPVTDVYALGVILYECLTGDAPFAGTTAQETMLKILTGPLRSTRDRRPDVPEGLAQVVATALARRVVDRYPSTLELDRALAPYEAFSANPSDGAALSDLATADLSVDRSHTPDFRALVRTPSPVEGPRAEPAVLKPRSRNKWLLAAAALCLVGALLWLNAREPEIAQREALSGEQKPALAPAKAQPEPLAPISAPTATAPAAQPRDLTLPAQAPQAPPEPSAKPEAPSSSRKERPKASRLTAARAGAEKAPEKPPAGDGAPTNGLPSLRLDRDNPYGQ